MHRTFGASTPRRVHPMLIAVIVIVLLASAGLAMAMNSPGALVSGTANPLSSQSPVPLPGQTGTSTCTNPQSQTQWRVTWRASGSASTPAPGATLRDQAEGTQITATAFSSRPVPGTPAAPAAAAATPSALGKTPAALGETPAAGETPASPSANPDPDGWTSRDGEVWDLRWTPVQALALSRQNADANQRQGTLADLAQVPVTAAESPRYVTPDGSCTVFATPFMAGQAGERTVAVIGDSLTAQLYASADGLESSEGMLQQQLEALHYRPEINGQAGRRWTAFPGTNAGIEQANADMVDELRGLRDAQSMVVALGVNDAGWVALSPDEQTYQLRMSWVLLHLAPVLDELRDHATCTVLVTMSADQGQTYLGSAKGRYQRAAERINSYLTERAGQDPNDGLKLWDWAAATQGHHTDDPAPWFGRDTIHLNADGQAAYTQQLSEAAQLC